MKSQAKRGMSLVELVVYIAILSLVTIVILNGILQLSSVFGKSRTERRVSLAAETALERMVREIRLAKGIDCLQLMVPAGNVCTVANPAVALDFGLLELDSYISHSDVETDQNKRFYCSSSAGTCTQIMLDTTPGSAGDEQQLTPNAVTVNKLTFRKITPVDQSGEVPQSDGVRIELEITSGSGQTQVTHTYYATAILRGAYTN